MEPTTLSVPVPPAGLPFPGVIPAEPDERAARRSLRDQIAKLERDLAAAFVAAHGRIDGGAIAVERYSGPRMLSLAELETLRDRLATRLSHVRRDLSARADAEEEKRGLIERMLVDPARYKWVRVTGDDVGETQCKSWHVRPRRGIIGMMMGWWQVKISSGCPLATGPRPG